MSLFASLLNWAKSLFSQDNSSPDMSAFLAPQPYQSNRESTHRVLKYLEALDSGSPTDAAFEQTPLFPDLGFTSLSLAETLYARASTLDVPLERIVHFLSIGIVEGGDERLATLLQRVSGLSCFNEEDRTKLLESGVVGDRLEIYPIGKEFNRVEFVVKFCRVLTSLKEQRDHEAVDLESTNIQADPEWKR